MDAYSFTVDPNIQSCQSLSMGVWDPGTQMLHNACRGMQRPTMSHRVTSLPSRSMPQQWTFWWWHADQPARCHGILRKAICFITVCFCSALALAFTASTGQPLSRTGRFYTKLDHCTDRCRTIQGLVRLCMTNAIWMVWNNHRSPKVRQHNAV
jgi:hypothetical protein